MTDWVAVAQENQFPVGTRRHLEVREAEVVVLRLPHGWFAVGNVCPHQGGPVGEGDVDGTTITCPWHQWRFDLTTGGELRNPVASVPVHDVKVEDGVVYVDRDPRNR